LDIITMHGPINVKSPNNITNWQMRFNSAFKGLTFCHLLKKFSVVSQYSQLHAGSQKGTVKSKIGEVTGETWSLTLREEGRLSVSENMVLRRVFGPRRDEVTSEWRKLHNEDLNDLYSLPNIVRVVKSRRMRWAGHVARMGEDRVAHRVLVGKPEGKGSLGRPRSRWEDNNKMDI
jgi:hypothetical protein